ncbi:MULTISPECIES: hypothetical protein [unclassified Exiguobacterium]|uniref:hypothetical protein n=1 Tax=unclassified Exiguobacterium TaxID=2644629 RepID=UPI001BE87C6C|nr:MULTISPECIES: hypothetical protein [unclassified Exiguobacterium]
MDTGEYQAFSLDHFGIDYTDMGGVKTEEGSQTTVKGLYVIGDTKNVFSGLLKAANDGYEVAAEINHEMAMEDWERGGVT